MSVPAPKAAAEEAEIEGFHRCRGLTGSSSGSKSGSKSGSGEADGDAIPMATKENGRSLTESSSVRTEEGLRMGVCV